MTAVPMTCPRCSAPTKKPSQTPRDPGESQGCTRCTWPNLSYKQVKTTLAHKDPTSTDQELESVVASLPEVTTLKDPQGRVVKAKVFEVHVHDGHVDVTFEFDPNAWAP